MSYRYTVEGLSDKQIDSNKERQKERKGKKEKESINLTLQYS